MKEGLFKIGSKLKAELVKRRIHILGVNSSDAGKDIP
jgi:hypothetical protein